MRPLDTHPDVYSRQVEVWRRIGPEGRISRAIALSEALREIVRSQLRSAHPGSSEWELRLAFVERVYGVELADRVRAAKALRQGLAGTESR